MKVYKTCIVRLASFTADTRLRKQVNALLENDFKIDLICTKFSNDQPLFEKNGNLRIFRLPFGKFRSDSELIYLLTYSLSFFIITMLLSLLSFFNRYQTIQVHTLPDFLSFTSIIPKLFGVKIVTDFHEPSPELVLTKFGNNKKLLYKATIKIEQLVIKYSDLSLTVTNTLKERFVQRGAKAEKIKVVTNVIDDYNFIEARNISKTESENFVLISHGSIEKRYGHEIVIHAVNDLKKDYPSIKFYICGLGSYEDNLKKLTAELGCEENVKFFGYLPYNELLSLLRNSDIGIISMPRNPYSELIDTNKLYEYIAMGIPVIHSRLEPVQKNFPENCIQYYEPGNKDDLIRAILDIYNNPEKRSEQVKNADINYSKLR